MNYQEARTFVSNAARKGSILGLYTITELMKELRDPQEKLKVVHVAGTNGKGSVMAYLLSILTTAGYRTGRYNSPAVFDYLEVFSINGKTISEKQYAKYMTMVKEACVRLEQRGIELPTAFELETAMAYLYFYHEQCDIVLIETGMGGDLDATNVVRNTLLSLITPVSLDHCRYLGDTVEEIAVHKAGIIKPHSAVITAGQEERVSRVLRRVAEQCGAVFRECAAPYDLRYAPLIPSDNPSDNPLDNPLDNSMDNSMDNPLDISAGKSLNDSDRTSYTVFSYRSVSGEVFPELSTGLMGTFQPYNAVLSVEAALYLQTKGFAVTKEMIREGIKKAVWHGRFEQLGTKPLVFFDGGHNPGAAAFIRKSIEIYFTNKRIVYIIGVLADKDYESVLLQTADLAGHIITVTPHNARALPAGQLAETARKYHSSVTAAGSIKEALSEAKERAGKDGVVFIFGSLSYLAEIRESCQ